jgi:hypothetical protein
VVLVYTRFIGFIGFACAAVGCLCESMNQSTALQLVQFVCQLCACEGTGHLCSHRCGCAAAGVGCRLALMLLDGMCRFKAGRHSECPIQGWATLLQLLLLALHCQWQDHLGTADRCPSLCIFTSASLHKYFVWQGRFIEGCCLQASPVLLLRCKSQTACVCHVALGVVGLRV